VEDLTRAHARLLASRKADRPTGPL
jgi:hypothetical protein